MKTYQIIIHHAAGIQTYTGLFTDGFAATIDALDHAPEGSRISALCLGSAA
jgi:hypothetical protein